jgi:hypothetical protein
MNKPFDLASLLAETNELVKIFHSSISTARKALSAAASP